MKKFDNFDKICESINKDINEKSIIEEGLFTSLGHKIANAGRVIKGAATGNLDKALNTNRNEFLERFSGLMTNSNFKKSEKNKYKFYGATSDGTDVIVLYDLGEKCFRIYKIGKDESGKTVGKKIGEVKSGLGVSTEKIGRMINKVFGKLKMAPIDFSYNNEQKDDSDKISADDKEQDEGSNDQDQDQNDDQNDDNQNNQDDDDNNDEFNT